MRAVQVKLQKGCQRVRISQRHTELRRELAIDLAGIALHPHYNLRHRPASAPFMQVAQKGDDVFSA